MVTIRISGAIIVLSLFLLSGCSNAGYENGNANANANANANRAAVNANTPASTSAANTNSNDNRRIIPTREEYERNKEKYSQEAKEAGRKVGTGVHDGWLWVKARYDLAAADDLRDSTINVDVDHDVLTLTGTVPTAAQKTKAGEIAKAVEGVKAVKNQIAIATAKPSPSAPAKKSK
jgi:hypothetical protein